ncbi:MAG: plasmid replication protein, CyRepA1 family [Nanopusillaceae archaeon]
MKSITFFSNEKEARGARGGGDPRDRILEEFSKSAVPPELITANISYSEGEALLAILSADAIAAIQGNQKYITQRTRKILDRYEPIAQTGAWVAWGTTLDGTSGTIPIIKPFCPRTDRRNKVVKYETPAKCPATPLLPIIPQEYLKKIANLWKIELDTTVPAWKAIQAAPQIPIIITEGLKKSLALIAQGIPAIAIRGITQWHAKGSKEPYPEIAQFCQKDRKIFVAFDQDENPKPRKDTTKQALKLGMAIEALSGQEIYFLHWPGPAKGIDDYLYSIEESDRSNKILALLDDALPIKKIKRHKEIAESQYFFSKTKEINEGCFTKRQEEFISNLPLPWNRILAISAPVGKGKTTEIVRIAKEWKEKEWKEKEEDKPKRGYVIVLSPRNSLGLQIAQKIGIPHVHDYYWESDLHYAIRAYGGVALCPDSLHRLPDEVRRNQNNLLILDEANQVCRHVINGDTLKQKWLSHNQLFRDIIKGARGIIAAEADLPYYCLQFLQGISGKDISAFQYNPNPSEKWKCAFYDYPTTYRYLFDEKLIEAGKNKKIIIVSTSKIYLETLEKIFISLKLDRKIIRIDSDTNENGQFDKFFADPDKWIEEVTPDILMLSPSAESGVSIQAGVSAENAYFREVWGYFPILSPNTAMQLLGRYRPAVPRHIFCPEFVPPDPLEMVCPAAIKERLNFLAKGYAKIYQIEENISIIDQKYQSLYENYFAHEGSANFHAKRIHRSRLKLVLKEAGHEVIESALPTEKDAVKKIKEGMKEIRQLFKEIKQEIRKEKADLFASLTPGPEHTVEWARETLEKPQTSSKDRALASKVLKLNKLPEIAAQLNNPEFVYLAYYKDYARMDKQAEMRAITELGKECLITERENINRIIGPNAQIVAKHKLPTKILAATILNHIGILRLLDLEEYDNDHEIIKDIKEKAVQLAPEIWKLLRLDINRNQTGVTIANKLLKRLGLKAVVARQPRRDRGSNRPRFYRVEDPANSPNPTEEQKTYQYLLNAWRTTLRRTIAQLKHSPQPDHTPLTPPTPHKPPPPAHLPNPPP